MALSFKTVPVPFGQGLAQQAAPHLLAPGKLAQADNGVIDKLGSIEVRPGFQDLPVAVVVDPDILTSSLTAIHRLIGHGGQTLVSNGYRFLSYSEGEEKWVDKDNAYEATVADRIQGERGRDAINTEGDAVYCNGYYAHTWYQPDEGKIYIRFTDAVTGARFQAVGWDSTQPIHRIVVAGDLVHVIYYNTAFGAIYGATFDTTSIGTSIWAPVSTSIGATADAPGIFDAYSDELAGVTKVYLAYNYNSTQIRICKLTSALALEGAQVVTASSSKCIAITAAQGQYIFVGYTALSTASPNGVCYFCFTEAMALANPPTMIDNSIYASTSTEVRAVGIVSQTNQALVVWEERQATLLSKRTPKLVARWVGYNGTLGDGSITHRIGMLSRPIIHQGGPYIVGYYHEKSHTHITDHDCPGYPNRYAYLLHIDTSTVTIPEV